MPLVKRGDDHYQQLGNEDVTIGCAAKLTCDNLLSSGLAP